MFLLRTARLSLTSMISIMAGSFCKIGDYQADLAQADELEAQRILLGVGFLSNDPEHLFGVRSHRRSARRGHLLGQLVLRNEANGPGRGASRDRSAGRRMQIARRR